MTAAASAGVAIIAEDEATGRLLLAEAAASAGLTPLAFDNGRAALQAATAQEVAIVLLDVDMPELDGYSVCRQLRGVERLAAVPIVMVTGHDDTTAINRAFEAGATDYISKPVNWDLLPHRLAYILRNAASVRRLADREAKVRTLIEAIPDALWVVSPQGEVRWSPNDLGSVSETEATLVKLRRFEATIPGDRLPQAMQAVADTAADGRPRKIEYRESSPEAPRRSAELVFTRCEDGNVLVVRRDTSERTMAAERIERLAYFDALTGLSNRQRCIDVAASMIAEATRSRHGVAVIYLDLNSFKRVNDSFGHSVGDRVLHSVAEKLQAAIQPLAPTDGDLLIARLGGDEFAILVRHADARALAHRIATACCGCLKEPILCNDLEFFTSPSIGVAAFPQDGGDIETLLKHADTAMYHAKGSGTAEPVFYTEVMSARVRDWHDLESRLRKAVREDLLELRFQPKFRVADQSIAGVEALARWYDERHGEIPPHRFIDIAEESGLILDVGRWLVGAACRQLREWLDKGLSIPIAINISGKDLLYGDPARIVQAELDRWKVPAQSLEIEITESVFVNDSSAGRKTVQSLRGLGCRIALDDFGTGYSSLAYLSRFPPDRIKIDRSFVRHVDESPGDAAIVRAVLSLSKSLGLTVTAEGVERASQLQWLRAAGCDEVQGYLLARPMAAGALESRFFCGAGPEGRIHTTLQRSA